MKRAFLLAVPLVLSAMPALAAGSCFPMRELDGWRAADAKTIYLRVAQTRYFRLDLSAPCSLLTAPGAHLITQTRGSNMVCSGADWDLAVSRDTPGSLPMHCIVKTQTELTKEEADALPKDVKPH
jgi:hypothetical protein